jgi:hypothetical protein
MQADVDGISVEGNPACGFLVLCDHASNALPPSYGSLGLPVAELERHIAYDIGAAPVTEILAQLLGVPARAQLASQRVEELLSPLTTGVGPDVPHSGASSTRDRSLSVFKEQHASATTADRAQPPPAASPKWLFG